MTSLRDRLQAIYDQAGELTPGLVVDTARDPKNPLHSCFEWDDTVAAEKYRIVQAGQLIRSVKVVYEAPKGPSTMRAFVPVRPSDHGPANFMPVAVAMADPDMAVLVLREFERAARALRINYGYLADFEQVVRRELLGEKGDES